MTTTNATYAYAYATDKITAQTFEAPTVKQFIAGLYTALKRYQNSETIFDDYQTQQNNPDETYYLELFLDGTFRVISSTDSLAECEGLHQVTGAMINLTAMNYREPSLFNELIEIINQAEYLINVAKDWGVYV